MRRTVTTTDVRAWEAAYDQGRTHNAIAVAHGRSSWTVRRHLTASGRIARGPVTKAARVRELLADGVEPWAIAERLGVTCRYVTTVKCRDGRAAKDEDVIEDLSLAQVSA